MTWGGGVDRKSEIGIVQSTSWLRKCGEVHGLVLLLRLVLLKVLLAHLLVPSPKSVAMEEIKSRPPLGRWLCRLHRWQLPCWAPPTALVTPARSWGAGCDCGGAGGEE